MAQDAVRVEDRTRKQAVAELPGNDLAAVQMSGQDQVVAGVPARLPDARIMCAQDADIGFVWRPGIGAGDRDHPAAVRHPCRAVLDPASAALLDGVADAFHPDPVVVIAANRENGSDCAEAVCQVTQAAQLRGTVHQVAPQQHHMRRATGRGIQHLPAERVRATLPEVNVADVEQSTRVGARRQALLPHVQGAAQPDLQHMLRERPGRIREPRGARPAGPAGFHGLSQWRRRRRKSSRFREQPVRFG